MAKRKRRRDTNSAPQSISTSQEPASYAYVQSVLRQQTAQDCDTLIREIVERTQTLGMKLNNLRYS